MNKRIILISTILFLSVVFSSVHAVTKKINPMQGKSTWLISKGLAEISDETTATPIFNANQIGGIITLSSSGNYQAAENLIYPISIQSDGVYLNLNGYTVSHNNPNDNIITVASNSSEININNGYVNNTGGSNGIGSGVLVGAGSSVIHLENLNVIGCPAGVTLLGSDGSEITSSELFGLELISNSTGIRLYYTQEITVKECNAIGSMYTGFDLYHSTDNGLFDCRALNSVGPQTVVAFRSDSGNGNLFQGCVAKKSRSTSIVFDSRVYGFLLTGTEAKTKIIDCIVNDTDIVPTGSATPYGIRIAPSFLTGNDLLSTVTMTTVGQPLNCVSWAPDAQHLAYVDTNNRLFVSFFNGTDILPVATYTTLPSYAHSVDWSPDGQYLVIGDNGYYVRVFKLVGSSLVQVAAQQLASQVAVLSVAWSPNGQFIACGEALKTVHIYSFNGVTLTHETENATPGDIVTCVTWSPDSAYIATGNGGATLNTVNAFNVVGAPGNVQLNHVDGDSLPAGGVNSVAWAPNGKYIVCGDSAGLLLVYDFNGTNLAMVNVNGDLQQSLIKGVAWSPDGDFIVSCDDQGFLRAWSFDLTSTVTFTTGPSYFTSDSWSPDGQYIATSDLGGAVRIYNVMYTPENCLIDSCKVCDTVGEGFLMGLGISGGGNNYFVRNISANNNMNYSSNILNVYNNISSVVRVSEPFDNISIARTT